MKKEQNPYRFLHMDSNWKRYKAIKLGRNQTKSTLHAYIYTSNTHYTIYKNTIFKCFRDTQPLKLFFYTYCNSWERVTCIIILLLSYFLILDMGFKPVSQSRLSPQQITTHKFLSKCKEAYIISIKYCNLVVADNFIKS